MSTDASTKKALGIAIVSNWRRVLLRAWSLWPGYLAFVLEVASELVPYVAHWLPWWVPPAIILLTPILRIIKQEKLHAGEPHREE